MYADDRVIGRRIDFSNDGTFKLKIRLFNKHSVYPKINKKIRIIIDKSKTIKKKKTTENLLKNIHQISK